MSLAVKESRMRSQGAAAPSVAMTSGDPGLLGGLIGGVTGFLTGGPGGALTGAVAGFKGNKRRAGPTGINLPGFGPPGVGIGGRVTPRFSIGETAPAAPAGAIPSGYRLNKSDYFLKDGTFVPKGTRLVKIRRRNALNPKALKAAMSRLTMAKKSASELGRVTIRKKKTCG